MPGRSLTRATRISPPVLVWIVLAVVTAAPYARATLAPPPGLRFLGVFFQTEDIHNYFGYVQQASEGAFLFQNKLVLDPHPGRLVNVEWWITGMLSRALGGANALAFRVVGLVASLALVLGVDRMLVFAGLPERHRWAALLWVFTAGGLGGLRYVAFGLQPWRSLDLIAGLFPFIEVLINPHFVVGGALLVWTLLAWERVPGCGGPRAAAVFGSALALSRPYDAALVLGIAGLAVVITRPPRRWLAETAPLLPMLAPLAYSAWVLYRIPAFRAFSSMAHYDFPPAGDMAVALAPAAVAGLAGALVMPRASLSRARSLAAWGAIGVALVVFHPFDITLQFLAGIGVPFIALAALGAARWPPLATVGAAVLFATTAVVAMRIVMTDNPRWMVPAERLQAAIALRTACHPGDVAFAPPDIGVYVLAHTPCRPFVSHGGALGFEERDAMARRFYTDDAPEARSAVLDRSCIAHVVLPGDPGDVPAGWLGAATTFRRTAVVTGTSVISVYSRARPEGCP